LGLDAKQQPVWPALLPSPASDSRWLSCRAIASRENEHPRLAHVIPVERRLERHRGVGRNAAVQPHG
jgi:hypothetical protein